MRDETLSTYKPHSTQKNHKPIIYNSPQPETPASSPESRTKPPLSRGLPLHDRPELCLKALALQLLAIALASAMALALALRLR